MSLTKIHKNISKTSYLAIIGATLVSVLAIAFSLPTSVLAQAQIERTGETGGNSSKPTSEEALRRPSLRSKSSFTRRVGEVNREICGRDKGCNTKLQKEQRRRGGNCSTGGNGRACNALSDGRIVGTEQGIGSAGETGGKIISKQTLAKGAGLASVTIGGILLTKQDQVRDPDFIDGSRTYVIDVVGKSANSGATRPLPGVKVTFHVFTKPGEKNGCQNNGTGKEGPFSSTLSATTGAQGAVSFEHCSHQQIAIKLDSIPRGYKKVVSQGGGLVKIRSAQDNDLNATYDNGRITITLEENEPKKNKAEQCREERQRQLSKENQPTGSFGDTGGDKVTYQEAASTAIVHNVIGQTNPYDFSGGTSSECQSKINHDRNYVVRVHTIKYPNREKGIVTSSFPVELKFHGPGTCKTANPGRSGGDSVVKFEGCSRNQFDLQVATQRDFPVVHKIRSNAGYVRVKGNIGKFSTTVIVNVYLENELQPYSTAQRAHFAAAATKYWNSIPKGAKDEHGYSFHLSQVTHCTPDRVKLLYRNGNFNSGDALAQAPLGAAKGGANAACEMTINKEGRYMGINGTTSSACIVFVHEYGHLMGFSHATNPRYMMYSHPNVRDPNLLRASGCL